MTFEEAIDIVTNHEEEDGLYRLPDGLGLGDATYIIRQLEKSYAPKIESPFKSFKKDKYSVKVYSLGMLLDTVIFGFEGNAIDYANSLPYKTIVEVIE